MTSLACVGEPISWLRLELFASGHTTDPAIASHLTACLACTHCLDEIRGDLVALPVLALPAAAPRRASWWTWLVPALGLAAAAVALLVLAPWRGAATTEPREDRVAVKGLGEVIVDVVRERAGVIRDDVRTYATGDRWKIVVTCPPAGSASFAVGVTESGRASVDRPLSPATLACGNRVALPGAFELTGTQPNRVCVSITSREASGRACVTILPE